MNYEKQLEVFYSNLNFNSLSTNAMTLYQAILYIAHIAKRTEQLSIANTRLMTICNLSLKPFQAARNELVTKKYLIYQKGRNQNETPKYCIASVFKETECLKGQAEVQAEGQAKRKALNQAEVNALDYINTLDYDYTTLDLFFNFIINNTRENFLIGDTPISEQDRQNIINYLKKLGIYIEDKQILDLCTKQQIMEFKILYWCIKEIYFSSYGIFLNQLQFKDLKLRFLKAKEYVATKNGIEIGRVISYFIKCIQMEIEKMKINFVEGENLCNRKISL